MFGTAPWPRCLAAALRDAEDPKPAVRRSAVGDLARLTHGAEHPAVVAALGRRLSDDAEPSVRAMAALAAAEGGVTELEDVLVLALSDPSVEVQRHALLALGELCDPDSHAAVEHIRERVTSPMPALRYQALVALSLIEPGASHAALFAATDDSDEEVRWVALRLLDETWAVAAPFAREQLEQLSVRLRDPSPRVALRAAVLLARSSVDAAIVLILRAISSGRGLEREERQRAIEVAGELRLEAARPRLTRLARCGWFEGPHGWAATVALAQLGDPASQRAVRDELGSREMDRRVRAVLAVEHLGAPDGVEWLLPLADGNSGVDPELIRSTIERMRHRSG